MNLKNKDITGSVQIKNGNYYLSINLYVNGVRKPKMINTKLSVKGYNKRKADEMLKETLDEINNPTPSAESFSAMHQLMPQEQISSSNEKKYPGDNILVTDYFERWLMRMKKNVRITTWNQYSSNVNNRIIPYFRTSNLMMSKVEPHHIQAFYDFCGSAKRLDGKEGEISSSTLRRIHANLSKAFRDALRLQEIPSNPVAGVEIPQNNIYHAKYYTAEQLKILLDTIKGIDTELPIMLCAYYGLRRSEALGIKWNAIDFEAKTILIQHTVTVSNGNLIKADITKNKSSYRTMPLLPEIEKFLINEKSRQEKLVELFGSDFNIENYVCINGDGTIIQPNKVSRSYKSVCKKASLPETRLHDIRHTNASILVKNSCNMKEVQRWLGHSDIKTTGNRYSHLETNDLLNASTLISKCLV